MGRNRFLPFILLIGAVLIIVDFLYFRVYNKDEEPKKEETKEVIDNKENEKYECEKDHTCVKIDNVYYSFSNKKEIKVSETYNYETETKEAGKLVISDSGSLAFINLKDEVLKTYSNIEGKVISIEETNAECDNKIYAVLTEDGKVYSTDINNGLLSEEAFLLLELDEIITGINIVNVEDKTEMSNEQTMCIRGKIIGLTIESKVIDITE